MRSCLTAHSLIFLDFHKYSVHASQHNFNKISLKILHIYLEKLNKLKLFCKKV